MRRAVAALAVVVAVGCAPNPPDSPWAAGSPGELPTPTIAPGENPTIRPSSGSNAGASAVDENSVIDAECYFDEVRCGLVTVPQLDGEPDLVTLEFRILADHGDRTPVVQLLGTSSDEPATPENFDEKSLPFPVRAEMKGLPKELANTVGAHIFAAGELIDIDPELAYKHAEAARRRAGRLPVVREAAAETAYAAGHFDVALREYRAIRRMSGGDELIPVIADCERALGKPREALETLASIKPQDAALKAECLLVEAGARDDLGQRDEALRILKAAISGRLGSKESQARLRYAYANLLEEGGDTEPALHWFNDASELDVSGDLDTADRIANLEGVTLPDSMELEPEEPEDTAEREEASFSDEIIDGGTPSDNEHASTMDTSHENSEDFAASEDVLVDAEDSEDFEASEDVQVDVDDSEDVQEASEVSDVQHAEGRAEDSE